MQRVGNAGNDSQAEGEDFLAGIRIYPLDYWLHCASLDRFNQSFYNLILSCLYTLTCEVEMPRLWKPKIHILVLLPKGYVSAIEEGRK